MAPALPRHNRFQHSLTCMLWLRSMRTLRNALKEQVCNWPCLLGPVELTPRAFDSCHTNLDFNFKVAAINLRHAKQSRATPVNARNA